MTQDQQIQFKIDECRELGISRRVRIFNTLKSMNWYDSSERVLDMIERSHSE